MSSVEVVVFIALIQLKVMFLQAKAFLQLFKHSSLNLKCGVSTTGWQLQTHLGSLELGDLHSTRNIRTYGPKVTTVQESGALVSIFCFFL